MNRFRVRSRMLAAIATSLFLFAVLAALLHAQAGTISPTLWEYKVIRPFFYGNTASLTDKLKQEGDDGWEVAEFIPEGGPTSGTLILKRIKRSGSE